MARPLRIEFAGAHYHVMNRGNRRQAVFLSDADRWGFLDLLGEITDRFGVEIISYCLMGNHYHLFLRTPEPNLGRAMQHLDGVHAQRFNKRHGLDGAVFRGRYRAILVDSDEYLATLARYIHRNPIEAGFAGQLVDYRWSSYPALVGEAHPPQWLQAGRLLNHFGSRDSLRAFTENSPQTSSELDDFYSRERLRPVLGSAVFTSWAARQAEPCHETASDYSLLHERPTLAAVDSATVLETGTSLQGLHASQHGKRNNPRHVALLAAQRIAAASLADIALHYSFPSDRAAGAAIARARIAAGADPEIEDIVCRVRRRMFDGATAEPNRAP